MNYIQKIIEDFDFNSIQDDNNKAATFVENILDAVDLGLPSGTLWCKCNLGAKTETEYGDYYAWGELNTKDEYTYDNYMYNKRPNRLPHDRDVATQKLGIDYCIPTKKQWEELLKYTDNKLVKNYKGTGVNGTLFASKLNGNSIFIPAAGVRNSSSLYNAGSDGHIWSSSLFKEFSNYAWCLYFGSDCTDIYYCDCYYGRSVRPVFKK